jgi:NADPH:quinone reductase-like Zn-dependent oxidoreductase
MDIARVVGARVIASAGSPAKLSALTKLGAELIVDHSGDDVVARVLEFTNGLGASIVFEHVARATWERSLALCASGGTIVSAGATSGDEVTMDVTAMFVKQVRILGSRLGTMDDAFAAVRHLNSGAFAPLIADVLPLDGVAEGHRRLEQGDAAGKLVVRVGG